jgi:hypothetical protein
MGPHHRRRRKNQPGSDRRLAPTGGHPPGRRPGRAPRGIETHHRDLACHPGQPRPSPGQPDYALPGTIPMTAMQGPATEQGTGQALDNKRLTLMTVRWPDVRLHARAGSEGPRLLSAASTCRLSPVSRPRTRARARNPRPQRTAGQPAPRIPLPPGGSPADHALAGGRAVTRAPVGHPRLLHMASTRPGGSTASLSCASG